MPPEPIDPCTIHQPSKDELFLSHLNKAIQFHQQNENDPHNIGNAVIAALVEVRNAFAHSHNLKAK